MNVVNAALTRLADWLLWPLSDWPLVPLLVWSAVVGVLMTIVFRYTSNQRAVRRAADRSRAQALAIKLFGHDLRAVFESLLQLLRYTVLRLLYTLPPVVVMLVPFTLFFSQLALRYECRPLEPHERAIVKLELAEKEWPAHQNVALQSTSQIAVETPALRDASEHAIYWRVRPVAAGPTALRWRVGDEEIEKRVDVATDGALLATVSTRRAGRGWWDRIINPAEPALAVGSPIVAIEVEHPPRETPIWGWRVPWWLTSILTSIVAALLAAPIFKVRF